MKNFDFWYNYDLDGYTKERDGIKHIPWYNIIKILNKEGYAVRYNMTYCNSDYIEVVSRIYRSGIDAILCEFTIEYPRSNNLHYDIQRAFVKVVAINLGLGLSMWEGEDEVERNLNKDITIKLATLLKSSGTIKDALALIGHDSDSFKDLLSEGSDFEKIKVVGLINNLI